MDSIFTYFFDRIYRIIRIIFFHYFSDESNETQPTFGGKYLLISL
jgi:hypothetical protein